MMYNFPPEPWRSNVTETVVVHLCWLLGGALILLWLSRSRRKPTIWDAGGMLFVAIILNSVFTTHNTDYRGHPTAYPAFVIATWLMTAIATIWNWYRLANEGERWDFGVSLSVIFGMMLFGFCMVPALHYPPEAVRRTACKYNLKELGLAFWHYHDTYEVFPAQVSGDPLHSWRVDLLPYLHGSYLDESSYRSLVRRYDFELKWDSGTNKEIAETEISFYQCPSNPFDITTDGFPTTAYAVLVGSGTILQPEESLQIQDFTDGTINTFLAVEACGLQIPWSKPQDVQLEKIPMVMNAPGQKLGESDGALSSFHTGGVQVLMADGAVRFVSEETDQDVLKALTTANGEEEIESDAF